MAKADSQVIGDKFPLLYDDELPPVSTSAVVQITGIPEGTINVWINRGVVLPGVKAGVQGRTRLFDASLVVHLAVMSSLLRLGYPALTASRVAIEAFQAGPHPREPGVTLLIKTAPLVGRGGPLPSRRIEVIQRPSQTSPAAVIETASLGPLESFAVVDLSAIWTRVTDAIKIVGSSDRVD